MKNLSTLLKEFDGSNLNEDELTDKFEDIARAAIYGGHFRVNDDYNIFIDEIEFYFHSENDSKSTIHDWAMYHRNHKCINVDYFPIGSLHPHRSGIDVTFERKDSYRASFLIRKYRIGDKVIKTPSYLREDLIGYTGCIMDDGPCISWINDEYDKTLILSRGTRINLSAYDVNGNPLLDNQGKKLYDFRPWRFSRPDSL